MHNTYTAAVRAAHRSAGQSRISGTRRMFRGGRVTRTTRTLIHLSLLLTISLLLYWVLGCGGGYPGGGLSAISVPAAVDSGQTAPVVTGTPVTVPVMWSVSCNAANCGSISGSTYTAPIVTVPTQVTITASVPGTNTSQNATLTVNPAPSLTGALPSATVGTAYSANLHATGGTGALTLSIASGSLPAGLALNAATGVISGIPTAAGVSSFVAQVTDSAPTPLSVKQPESITVVTAGASLQILSGNPPVGTVGTPYSTALTAAGGAAPYTFSVIGGALPAGLMLSSSGVISGTPSAAGTTTFTAQVQDTAGARSTGSFSITINNSSSSLSITVGSLPNGTVGTPYSATVGLTGGAAPYTCTLAAGTLPAGLSLSAGCLVSGTPTVAGTATLTVKATDSSNPVQTTTGPMSLTISPAGLSLTTGTLPAGTVGTPYSSTIGVAGGTSPYQCAITGGTLQAGLGLGANCLVSGTPTAAGTATLTVKATDSSNPTQTITGTISLTVNPQALALSVGTLPNGTVGTPYSSTIGVTGGTAPYQCSITGGTLQAGLMLGANCLVSGTPTAPGTTTLTVKATDSSNPALTATGSVSLTINPQSLSFSTGTLPNGTVGTPYSSTIGITGGTAPYQCSVTGGTLQAGLSLGANCLVSGTPTAAGTTTLTVKATDSSTPALTTTGSVSLTISPQALALSTGTLPNGTVGTPYSSTIGVTGGTGPYSCTVTAGSLPAGLSIGANCLVSGTPTTPGAASATVKVTDSGNPQLTASGPVAITINPGVVLTLSAPATGMVNTPYTGTIGVTGGTGPYTCTLNSGTLPVGLALNTNCTVSGTPTASGTSTVNVSATDSSSPKNTTTGNVTITINPATITLTLGNPPAATLGTPYTGLIPVSGGTAPYTCSVSGGTLPAGLSLGATCTLTGTPTWIGSATVQVTATDSANPKDTSTAPVTIIVQAPPALAFTGLLPNAILNQPYSQTLAASGGVGPYTYAVTAGALPTGIMLNTTTGVVSGTPTAPGAATLTVTATDSESPAQTVALPLTLLVVYAPTTNDGLLQGPYAFMVQGEDSIVAGTLAYRNATVGSFSANGTGVLTTGELDTNHQTANPTGTQVPHSATLGTYTIGADNRGTLVISRLNADGTLLGTTTYAIAVRAAISPATTTTRGAMVQTNDSLLVSSNGSGMFLQQNASSFTTGLTGSYAFGLQGDTPCFPACTANLQAGPVATVGQVTVAGTTITGEADTNIGTANFPTAALSGTTAGADSNGRVQLSLTNQNLPFTSYPSDFAVYMVNGAQSLVMSTDKHSAYILLAGNMSAQSTTNFSNAALTGQYVGYENAPTNPGLAGVAAQNVANLSTATLFQGTANATGTCTTNYVEQGGTTALVNGLSGQGSGSNALNALLGTYASTGNSNCTVGTNGRAVLNYPVPSNVLSATLTLLGLPTNPPAPRVAYVTGTNTGYFLETGYAGLGNLEQQSGGPFSLGTLNGTYVYGTTPVVTAATLNASGKFTANGSGQANYVFDESVFAGNVNVATLGVTGTAAYVVTDAQNGRFTFGTDVIFAITHSRFVLVDKSATTVSPSVALID